MKIWCFVAAALIGVAAVTYATVSGNYEVKVQFVPPLVTADCSLGRWWSLPNMTCAVCFCITGTLSRCLPQPGCILNPSVNSTTAAPISNTTTTTTTTMMPVGMENQGPTTATSVSMPDGVSTSAPTTSSSTSPEMGTMSTSSSTTTTSTTEATMPDAEGGNRL